MADIQIPHIDLPPRFESGRVVYVEQDTVDEHANSVEVVCRYRPGDRPDVPEFGLSDPSFKQGGPDRDEIERAVEQWEPRVDIDVDSELDPVDVALARVGIEVRESG